LKPKILYTKKNKLTPYLVEACTLPNFMTYNNQELIITKKMFFEKYHTFQYHCMEWCKKCYAGGGIDYFTEYIYPLLNGLQPVFYEDDLVSFKQNTDSDKHTFTLIIGEVSPIHIWNYYKKQLTEFDSEFEEMQQNYQQIKAVYTVPVFIIMDVNEKYSNIKNYLTDSSILDNKYVEKDEEITDETLLTSKKNFDLDVL